MVHIPLKYNVKNLIVRWQSTVMTAVSIGLVVAVFIIIMSLAQGLTRAFITSGDPLNILVLRKGSTAESTSFITQPTYRIIQYLNGIKQTPDKLPMAAAEVMVLMNLQKIEEGKNSNVQIRGVSPESFTLREKVKIVEGRNFREGMREIICSKALSLRFKHLNLGDEIYLGKSKWMVVGHFDASETAFDSEIWGDIHEVMAAYDREVYSTALLRATDKDAADFLIKKITDEPRISLKAMRESDYFAEQTKSSLPIQIFGTFLAVIMSIGAIFAAINTMYASVANRTREIGTLRLLGFTPSNILISFMIESLILSFAGGLTGCLFSLPIDGLATGTANFETFSEIAFHFRITPTLLLEGILFSLIIGFIGGLLPALHAARQPVISSLKELE